MAFALSPVAQPCGWQAPAFAHPALTHRGWASRGFQRRVGGCSLLSRGGPVPRTAPSLPFCHLLLVLEASVLLPGYFSNQVTRGLPLSLWPIKTHRTLHRNGGAASSSRSCLGRRPRDENTVSYWSSRSRRWGSCSGTEAMHCFCPHGGKRPAGAADGREGALGTRTLGWPALLCAPTRCPVSAGERTDLPVSSPAPGSKLRLIWRGVE